MKPAELIVQKRNTKAFIEHDLRLVVFNRSTRTRNNRGGYDTTIHPTEPQRIRLVKSPLPRHKDAEQYTTQGPKTIRFDRVIAEIGVDMQAGDTFYTDDRTFLVSMVMDKPHEVEAVVEEQ